MFCSVLRVFLRRCTFWMYLKVFLDVLGVFWGFSGGVLGCHGIALRVFWKCLGGVLGGSWECSEDVSSG